MEYTVVHPERAAQLRHDFIETFTDQTLPFYRKILGLHQYYDGMCYTGYIWEVLRQPRIIRRDTALECLKAKTKLCILWDIRTNKHVAQPFQHIWPKDMVIETSGKSLADQLRLDFSHNGVTDSLLPEDIYIFDDSLTWYIVFTHEPDERADNLPMCMTNP